MISILSAVNLYQKKVGKCVEVANEVIYTYEHIRFLLHVCNAQMEDISSRSTLSKPTLLQASRVDEDLAFVGRRVFELNGTVAIAQLDAIAQLAKVFEDMRSALDACEQLLHGDLECVKPIMIRCHRDIDDVCHRLVDSCIVDTQVLKAMGIDNW